MTTATKEAGVVAMPVTVPAGKYLVRREQATKVTKGGIVLADNAQEKPYIGRIVEAGPAKLHDSGVHVEPQWKVDDRVLYTRYGGTEVKIYGVEHVVIGEAEVLLRVEDGVEIE